MTPMRHVKTQRDLLVALGIGQFNATMIIPMMLTQPATTDPKSPAIIMLVRAIQNQLYVMGATHLDNTGYLDMPTAEYLDELLGPQWINRQWADVVRAVVTARQNNVQLRPPAVATEAPIDYGPQAQGAFDFLPAVPGGALTYVAGAGLLYYLWTKRKR